MVLSRMSGRRGSICVAEAILHAFAEKFLTAGASERDLGLRFADLAEGLMPLVDPLVGNVVAQHMHELVRQTLIGRAELVPGQLPGTAEITVAFADMVGFTRLGQASSVETIGSVAKRFEVIPPELR
jgi:adenylate cyclase